MLRCHVFRPKIYKKNQNKTQQHSNSPLVWSIFGRSHRTFIWVAEGARTSWPDSTTTRAPRRRATFSSHSLSSAVSSARTLPRVAFSFFFFLPSSSLLLDIQLYAVWWMRENFVMQLHFSEAVEETNNCKAKLSWKAAILGFFFVKVKYNWRPTMLSTARIHFIVVLGIVASSFLSPWVWMKKKKQLLKVTRLTRKWRESTSHRRSLWCEQ